MNRIPNREPVERLRQQYPVGTRITLNHMDDPHFYVDDMGQIGVKWDNGSSLSLIPGVDSFSKEPAPEKKKSRNSYEAR